MALGINVDGTHYVIPQVLSIVDVSELVDPPSFPTGRLAILGEGTGLLTPQKPTRVQATKSNIQSILQPGDLRNAALMAINPSPQLSGVPELYLCPVNPATRAIWVLDDGAAADAVRLTTQGYGTKYNQVKVTITSTTLTLQLDRVIESFTLTGLSNAAKVALINARSNLVTAELIAEGNGALATVSEPAPTTAAVNGTVTEPDDYDDMLGLLNALDINLIVVTSATASVHGSLATHVNTHTRRGFFGRELAAGNWQVYANRATNIATIRSNRASSVSAAGEPRMLTPGIGLRFTDDVLYPSRITCAMWAGIAALVPPTTPLTNKTLNASELEVELDDAEVSELLEGGISVPMRNHGPGRQGFVVSHQRTTWVADDNLSRIEFSVGRGIDAIQRAVTEELWQFIGEEGVAEIPARAAFITNKLLQRAASGIDFIRIVTFNPKATRGELIGTILRVFFEYTPILPVNFVIAIAKLRRTSITANITDSFDITLSGLGGSLDQQTPV